MGRSLHTVVSWMKPFSQDGSIRANGHRLLEVKCHNRTFEDSQHGLSVALGDRLGQFGVACQDFGLAEQIRLQPV